MSVGSIGNPFLFYITAVTLSLFVIYLSKWLSHYHNALLDIIIFLGKNSLAVLIIHYLYVLVFVHLANYLTAMMTISIGNELLSLIIFLFVVALAVPTIKVINMYVPNLVGKQYPAR